MSDLVLYVAVTGTRHDARLVVETEASVRAGATDYAAFRSAP